MKPAFIALLLALSLIGCSSSATSEDRAALIGLWAPEDGSGLTIEFRENGEFDFVYAAAPTRTILRVGWQLERKGSVDMLEHDGSVYKSCPYRIEGRMLTIDDGRGAECLRSATAPTVRMARRFQRVP
ncbi:hypothetical protein [Shinella sp.]|uniref:hypothetical protein n=1 Tax=Shinella sp. TaxID=1870904 RepID=UPI002586541B|nr:hypothetical protein [Shinella sp.]MCW5710032.1 hypothetical protein [Shinella sp.]